nr:tetratricopeptide repeat protein [Treponema sp.]
AVIFCAEIYADNGNYRKAISVLEPYTNGKDDFAARCSFFKANYYDKSDDLKSAVAAYQKVCENFPRSIYADQAMFRCGELYYSRGELKLAEEAFTKYLYEYSNGKFTDGAFYFSGECSLKNGQLDRSIMQNRTLLEKYPQSSYSYGAGKNLLEAYYQQERYSEALETARMLVKNYRVQANSDSIGKRIIELEQITAGTDRRIVEKKSEYEQKGKLSTKGGRICGTELVKLYSKYGSQGEALSLALSLVQVQTDATEAEYGAENSEFAASYYAKNSNAKQSAEFYLKAAAFYRTAGNSQKAAASLYSAADSFMTASMKGDAQETAKLLVQLYPDTKQAKKVMDLVK